MLDPLGQAWQTGSALAAYIPGRVAVNKYCNCGSLQPIVQVVNKVIEQQQIACSCKYVLKSISNIIRGCVSFITKYTLWQNGSWAVRAKPETISTSEYWQGNLCLIYEKVDFLAFSIDCHTICICIVDAWISMTNFHYMTF